MARTFEDYDASTVKKELPLLVGITAPSSGGKSYSAGRLATGMQSVVGGKIFWIDCENDRALELRDYFKFQHVPFLMPKSPLECLGAVEYCLAKEDCGVIIFDTASAEHQAVLNMSEEFLERKCGNDWDARERMFFPSLVRPKAERKRFEERVAYGATRPDGKKVPIILLYRSHDSTKPGKSKREGGDGKPVHVGWKAETTSQLPYNMTVRFLLPPGSDGRPTLTPETVNERLYIKNPEQFRDWFKPGFQLDEELGAKLARWAAGSTVAASPNPPDTSALLAEIKSLLANLAGQDQKKAAVAAAFNLPWAKVQTLDILALSDGLQKLRSALRAPASPPAGDHRDRVRTAASAKGITDQQLAAMVSGSLDDMPPEAEDEVMAAIENYTGREPGEEG
jgi:hypothetical protein